MAGTLGGGGRRRRGMIAAINVTPLVDIVLVLLVILMVSSTYIVAQTLKVHLPKAKSSDGVAERPAIVTVTEGDGLRLDDRPTTEDELGAKLRAAVAENPDLNVVVSADRDVHHGDGVRVLDVAKLAGVVKFAINVQKK